MDGGTHVLSRAPTVVLREQSKPSPRTFFSRRDGSLLFLSTRAGAYEPATGSCVYAPSSVILPLWLALVMVGFEDCSGSRIWLGDERGRKGPRQNGRTVIVDGSPLLFCFAKPDRPS